MLNLASKLSTRQVGKDCSQEAREKGSTKIAEKMATEEITSKPSRVKECTRKWQVVHYVLCRDYYKDPSLHSIPIL